MSTLTKAIAQQRSRERSLRHLMTQQNMLLALLLAFVFISAFAVIYTRDLDRQLVSDWQGMQMQKTEMLQAYNQLWLEDSAWSTQSQIMDRAVHRLAMVVPASQSTTTLVS